MIDGFVKVRLLNDDENKISEIPFEIIKSINRNCHGLSITLTDGTEILTKDDELKFVSKWKSKIGAFYPFEFVTRSVFCQRDCSEDFNNLLNQFRYQFYSEQTLCAIKSKVIYYLNSILNDSNNYPLRGDVKLLIDEGNQTLGFALTDKEDKYRLDNYGIELPYIK